MLFTATFLSSLCKIYLAASCVLSSSLELSKFRLNSSQLFILSCTYSSYEYLSAAYLYMSFTLHFSGLWSYIVQSFVVLSKYLHTPVPSSRSLYNSAPFRDWQHIPHLSQTNSILFHQALQYNVYISFLIYQNYYTIGDYRLFYLTAQVYVHLSRVYLYFLNLSSVCSVARDFLPFRVQRAHRRNFFFHIFRKLVGRGYF